MVGSLENFLLLYVRPLSFSISTIPCRNLLFYIKINAFRIFSLRMREGSGSGAALDALVSVFSWPYGLCCHCAYT